MTDHLGPVDYVVIEFFELDAVRAGLDRLLALVERGAIRVLDLEFVKGDGAEPRIVTASDIGLELADFDGASSGLLDHDDLQVVAAGLSPNATAAVLVYEELSIVTVFEAWEAAGATILSQGPVEAADISTALGGSDDESATHR
jgi:hypothetical protein